MKKILPILAGCMISFFSMSQESSEGVFFCHTTEMQELLFEENPSLRPIADSLGSIILKKAKSPGFSGMRKDGDPYIIPVVFHIVHEGGEENISFEQIQNAVETMTNDFTGNNMFIESVNDNFQDIVADVGIEFRLAQRDPDGNCTNGVVRTFNYLTNEGGENLKEISPIWDRSRYLNIWVCKTIASGAAGYTYYPSTLAGDFGETNDGIVVRHDYVGGIGTSNLGRAHVLAHEVGHWIDLPHLWGSTNEPEVESNCETDDGVDDTPNTIGWTSCNPNGQSCGSLDNVQNFMEYSFCSYMFTEGQKTRMLAALTSPIAERNNLWTEETLISTGVLDEPELCDADFTSDRRTVCVGAEISFADLSFSAVESRSWIFEGGTPVTSSSANPVITYDSPGVFSVSLAAADADGNQITEVKEAYIQVLDTGAIDLPFSEGFESGESFDELENDAFYTENLFGPDVWEISTEAGSTGNHSAVFRGTEAEFVVDRSAFVSKTFQLSDVMENPVFSFKYAGGRRNSNGVDEVWVYISRNCGELWSLRKVFDDGEIYTSSGNFPNGYVPDEDDWQEHVIDNVVPVFQNEEFRMRFEFRGQGGGTVYIDDINLIDGATLNTAYQSADEVGFHLYPNPAKNGVYLRFGDEGQQSEQIVLYDVSGRTVDVIPANNSDRSAEIYVDLSEYSKGIYLLEVQSDRGASAKKLIID